MPLDSSLKRLGGGRWETRDGRFAIEPQSGTWVVVDTTQTDDLGLPLVRGPFGSLTAAKDAIEAARQSGPAESPLAERLRLARAAEPRAGRGEKGSGPGAKEAAESTERATAATTTKATTAAKTTKVMPGAAAPPTARAEPKWLRDLEPAGRLRAFQLIERLETLGLPDPLEIARAEVGLDQPALARVGLERALRAAIGSADSPAAAVRAALAIVLAGSDKELGAQWRLVDDRGRRVTELDLPD